MIKVEFANGWESTHAYRVDQLNFALRDHPFDIAKYWRIDGKDNDQTEEKAA